MVKIPGIRFEFPGKTLVIPPAALGDIEQMEERIAGYAGGIDKGSIATALDLAYVSLKRNYPDITREEIGRLIDVGNMLQVFEACMDVNGIRRKAQESGQGEASGPLNGANSTQN